MSDRTCGTCAHAEPEIMCEVAECIVPAGAKACDVWQERADSVEQVAREMLIHISLCEMGELHQDPPASTVYRDRLRALGVIE